MDNRNLLEESKQLLEIIKKYSNYFVSVESEDNILVDMLLKQQEIEVIHKMWGRICSPKEK